MNPKRIPNESTYPLYTRALVERVGTATASGVESARTYTCDFAQGSVFYLDLSASPVTANFTINVVTTGIEPFVTRPQGTTDNYAITTSIIVKQSSTGYRISTYQLNGSSKTIKWISNLVPTPSANSVDIFSLTYVSNEDAVLAGASLNYKN